ncbi:MAG: TraR/DksA family transcriptional regulator [Acidobacteria bacterium]|nr:TraR/DksA family transcriptional regulator [Acidobacteriota bacterium]
MMKSQDEKKYRAQLNEKLDALRDSIQTKKINVLENEESEGKDEGDLAEQHLNRDLLFHLSANDRRVALEVLAALERMDQGTYGRCEWCEEPIEPKRLDAVPWARMCLLCQEEQEQASKAGGVAELAEELSN